MTKRRIGWSAGFFVSALICAFAETFAGVYLFAGILFLLFCSVIVAALNNNKPAAAIRIPETCRKNQCVEGAVLLRKTGKLPVFKIEALLEIKNLMTGEVFRERMNTSVTGRNETEIKFNVETPLCGCMKVTLISVDIYDLLGVYKKTFVIDEVAEMLVLPDTFATYIQMLPGLLADNESIEYSQEKPGDDMSEIFGIREYMPGDSIKNIHWKLTGKYDDLMVRLPSLPMENSVLLLMETSGNTDDVTPHIYDAMCEIYVTLSQHLIHDGIVHEIAWFDNESGKLFTFDIEGEDDLLDVMSKILSASHNDGEMEAYSHYVQEHGEVGKAHIVYISQEYHESFEQLSDEIRKTTIVCNDQEQGDERSMVYYCSPENYSQELHYIAI